MRRWVVLLALVAAGTALRAYRLDWGLPGYVFPDAVIHFLRPAMAAAGGGAPGPNEFVHPPVVFSCLTAAFRLRAALTGEPVPPAGPAAMAAMPALTLLSRWLMVGFAALTLLALYALARRLIGPRGALFATACFAVAPLHVLESHRVGPDVPMLLFTVLAALAAVAAAGRSRALLLGSFGLAGLAAATKYTAVFAGTLPAWVALGPGAGERASARRVGLVALGGAVAALAFALAAVPAWGDPAAVVRAIRLNWTFAYRVGMPGVDLADGWAQLRYVYPLVVAIPYMMGWPVWLAALAGLVLLWQRERRVAGLLLAAMVPFFVFLGGSRSAVPRYYLHLAPFLAVAAGAALDRLWSAERRVLGRTLAAGVVAYTALLAASQVARLGLGPQRQVGALVESLTTRAGHPLVVGYPNRIALVYDPVASFLRAARARIVEFPPPFAHLATETPCDDCGAEVRTRVRAWLDAEAVDAVLFSSWSENTIRRGRPHGWAAHLVDALADGSLGFVPAAEFRTRYLTEGWYTWGDPMLDTHWETGMAGYRVFVRRDLDGGPR